MAFKWTSPRTWVAGEKPTAATLNQHIRDNLEALNGFVLKTADEPVTSNATPQDDNHLTYTIPQAGTYEIDAWLMVTSDANAAGDIQVRFTFPTGTLYTFKQGLTTALASAATDQLRATARADAASPSTAISFGCSTERTSIRIRAVLVATASGTLTLQWAQSVSNASATNVHAGSHMDVTMKAA